MNAKACYLSRGASLFRRHDLRGGTSLRGRGSFERLKLCKKRDHNLEVEKSAVLEYKNTKETVDLFIRPNN